MPAGFRGLPLCKVDSLLLVDVDPELFVAVIAHTLVLLVKPVECARDDVVLGFDGCAIKLDPLALLDKFEYVGARTDTVRQSGGSVPGQAEQGHDRWPLAL